MFFYICCFVFQVPHWLSIVTVSLGQFLILWGCCSRNSLKLQRSQALLSWLQNLMVFLVQAFRKYLLAMQYQCGKLFAPFKVQILFVHYSCQLCVSLCIQLLLLLLPVTRLCCLSCSLVHDIYINGSMLHISRLLVCKQKGYIQFIRSSCSNIC